MSDTSLTIELKANTSAAVSEVGKLKSGMELVLNVGALEGYADGQSGIDALSNFVRDLRTYSVPARA